LRAVDSIAVMSGTAVDTAELRDADASRRLGVYLRELWERRSYINHVATNELKSRQVTNVLGNLWHLLNPALSIGVYFLIFGVLLETDRGVDNFILFLTVGLFLYQVTQKSTTDGAKSIVTNKGVIKAVRFPRALLPISSTWTEFLASLPTFLVLFVVAAITGQAPRWSWLALIPLIFLQLIFNAGAAMIAARLTTHFVDMIQILPFIFRLLFYGSGVIFSVDAYVEDSPLIELLFDLNPMYCFISLGRWSVMGGTFQGELLLSAIVWSFAILTLGFLWFRAAEETYARD
jgi:teichoic acid transport system permease protein